MVLLGAISYGMLSSFAKKAYGLGYTAAEVTFTQASIGGLLLWAALLFTKIKSGVFSLTFDKRLLLAGLGMGVSSYTYYLSVQYIPASLAIVLLMQMTWISIFIEWLVFKRKPLVIELYVTLCILVGTVLAGNLADVAQIQVSLVGVGYALLSAVMYSIYIISTSRLGTKLSLFEKSAWMISGSTLTIFLINFQNLTTSTHYDWTLLQYGSFLAVFGTVIPPVLFAKGMPKIGAGLSAILLTMEMPVAVLFAYVLLGEEVTFMQLIGIGIMLGSIAYLNLHKDRFNTKKHPSNETIPGVIA